MTALPDSVRHLATGRNFACVTTLRADGQPATQVMWIDADGDDLLFNTEVHRRKYANLQADPRVTVTIWDATNPYRYAEVRGVASEFVHGEPARQHIDELAWRYFGRPYDETIIRSARVIVRVRPLVVLGPHAPKA